MDSTLILTPQTGTPALSKASKQPETKAYGQPKTEGLQGQVKQQV